MTVLHPGGVFRAGTAIALRLPLAAADWRFGAPQLGVSVVRASGGSAFRGGLLHEHGANAQRIGDAGLLIEPSRTNMVANPRFEGGTPGVLGAGGVMPATMSTNAPTGFTRTFVGTGTEDGIPYADIRWQGSTTTAFATFSFVVGPWVCSLGQTFALRFAARLVGGSLANISNTRMRVQERQGSTQVANSNKDVFTPTAAPLAQQQIVATHTIANSAADNALLQFAFDITPNEPVDVTFRFGLPQVEEGAGNTTPILPPVGAPAVSTRAAETAVMAVPGPDRPVRLLVQDLAGAEWRTVAVSGGGVPLDPRAGQTAIRRARVWEIGHLTAEQEAALAVPA